MKVKYILHMVLVILIIAIGGVTEFGTFTRSITLTEEAAQLSYSIGLQIGKSLGSQHIDINVAYFMRGLQDGSSGQPPLVTSEQVRQTADTILTIMMLQNIGGDIAGQTQNSFLRENLQLELIKKNTLILPNRLDY